MSGSVCPRFGRFRFAFGSRVHGPRRYPGLLGLKFFAFVFCCMLYSPIATVPNFFSSFFLVEKQKAAREEATKLKKPKAKSAKSKRATKTRHTRKDPRPAPASPFGYPFSTPRPPTDHRPPRPTDDDRFFLFLFLCFSHDPDRQLTRVERRSHLVLDGVHDARTTTMVTIAHAIAVLVLVLVLVLASFAISVAAVILQLHDVLEAELVVGEGVG